MTREPAVRDLRRRPSQSPRRPLARDQEARTARLLRIEYTCSHPFRTFRTSRSPDYPSTAARALVNNPCKALPPTPVRSRARRRERGRRDTPNTAALDAQSRRPRALRPRPHLRARWSRARTHRARRSSPST